MTDDINPNVQPDYWIWRPATPFWNNFIMVSAYSIAALLNYGFKVVYSDENGIPHFLTQMANATWLFIIAVYFIVIFIPLLFLYAKRSITTGSIALLFSIILYSLLIVALWRENLFLGMGSIDYIRHENNFYTLMPEFYGRYIAYYTYRCPESRLPCQEIFDPYIADQFDIVSSMTNSNRRHPDSAYFLIEDRQLYLVLEFDYNETMRFAIPREG